MAAEVPAAEPVNGSSPVVMAAFMPQLMVPANKAEEAVTFYKTAFGAEEVKRVNHPKRKAEQDAPLLLCAELKIGGASILICDLTDDSTTAEPKTESKLAPGVLFRIEAEDVVAAVANAVSVGGVAQGEITEEDGPCGGPGALVGKVKDPFGHLWVISLPGKCCPPQTTAA